MADHTYHTKLDGTVVASAHATGRGLPTDRTMPTASDQAVSRAASLSSAVAEMSRVRSGRDEPAPFVYEPSPAIDEEIGARRRARRSLFAFSARARAAVAHTTGEESQLDD